MLWYLWVLHLFFKHVSMPKYPVQGGPQSHLGGSTLDVWKGDRHHPGAMLYWVIVHFELDYGCILYGTAWNTKQLQLDSIHNSGLRLALGAFCNNSLSSLYTEANKAPLEECWL